MCKITTVNAREILDSRGNPTIEAEVFLACGLSGVASVPSGASRGSNEAYELRDEDDERFNGKGVLQAVRNINLKISPLLAGININDQRLIDQMMIDEDDTPDKSNLGANAILAVSLAAARAAARAETLLSTLTITRITETVRLPRFRRAALRQCRVLYRVRLTTLVSFRL